LKVIFDVSKNKKKIKKSIKKYGHFAEHNFFHYMYCETPYDKNVVFDYGRGRILLMQYEKKNNIWLLFPCSILAPKSERLKLLWHATNYVLRKKKAKKFFVEISEETRNGLMKKLKASKSLRSSTSIEILYWPVYDMKSWDKKLKGNRMKKLRNIRNRFYKRHRVSVKNTKDVPIEKLKQIFTNWTKKRAVSESIDKDYYLNLINSRFKGFTMAKTLYVNGNPATINAGWKIPNSEYYYSAIGIVDYSYVGLGEISNIDDLNRLKRKGYKCVDFGGSDKLLLRFKKKFKPERIYKTYIFSIVRI